MTRVSFANAVHFAGHGHATLCGFADTDLLGNPRQLNETSAPVTCPVCAELYCRIKGIRMTETTTEPISELDRIRAERRHLAAFLAGDWIDIPSETLADLMETATVDFRLDHGDNRLVHAASIRLSPAWTPSHLVDSVMLFSCPSEPVDLSISRLATAARFLGFSELTPYAAAVCYFRFTSLKVKYQCQKKSQTHA